MTGRIRLSRSLALVALLACAIAAQAGDAPAPVATISQDALSARQAAADGTLVVLDVRTPEEYATGHVPGAINIPHGEVEARLAELAPARDQDVVVYCLAGKRAALALEVLQKAGFTKLRHLDGDMQAWRANDRPVERAPERGPPPAML